MRYVMDSEEYVLHISRSEEIEEDLLFSLTLNQNLSFFKRLSFYLKYLFGYRCRYGDFDCLTLSKKDAEKIMLGLRDA